jgi:hypothetical protein
MSSLIGLGDIAGAIGNILSKIVDIFEKIADAIWKSLKAGFKYFGGLLEKFMVQFNDYIAKQSLQITNGFLRNPEGILSFMVFIRGVLS